MKTQLKQLKTEYRTARSETQKQKIKDKMQKLLNQNPEQFASAMLEIAQEVADDADTFLQKDKILQISKIVSMAYIAKHYFGKSRSWLCQRLNGNIVNGKVAEFTPEEKNILNDAFKDIAKKIGSVSI